MLICYRKVVDFLQPDVLRQKFDFEIGLKGVDDDTLVKYCEDTIKYSVKTGENTYHSTFYVVVHIHNVFLN